MTQLLAYLVQGIPHQAEVFLGGVSAAEALGGGAVGHVVQQGLAGGADDGDDVGTLAGGGGGLHHVLIDVAGGHDQVDPGALLLAAVGGNEVLAALAAGADLGQALLHDRSQGGVDVRLAVDGQLGPLQLVGGHVLGDGLGTLAGLHHGVADPEGGALGQRALVHQVVHHDAGQGDIGGVHTVNAQQAADGALDSHGGAAVDKALGVVGHAGGVGPGLLHQLEIKIQLGFQQ